mmetsp:Transcript_57651/g.174295  ORF Transcript_57651/g.174295 Transcript_57651/m.174295 type:complete len:408 (+) Transcript_57651:631-1854(+)
MFFVACACDDAAEHARRRIVALRWRGHDKNVVPREGLGEFESVDRAEVVHLHGYVGACATVSKDLCETFTLPEIANPEDSHRWPQLLGCFVAPAPVLLHPLCGVLREHGTVACGNGVEVESRCLFERREHRACIWFHQAVVVESVVWQQRLNAFCVFEIIGAVMHAEGIASVKQAGAVVESEHRIGPVQVGRNDELQLMAATQVDLVVVCDNLALERGKAEVFKELDANLRTHHRQILVARSLGLFQNLEDEPRVVRLGVRHDDVGHRRVIDLLVQRIEEKFVELFVGCVNNRDFVAALDDVGVVSRATLESELNVEAVAVPIERTDRRGIRRNAVDSHGLQTVLLPWRQARPRFHFREVRLGDAPALPQAACCLALPGDNKSTGSRHHSRHCTWHARVNAGVASFA